MIFNHVQFIVHLEPDLSDPGRGLPLQFVWQLENCIHDIRCQHI